MTNSRIHAIAERLREGQTPRQALMSGVVSFIGGVATAIVVNWLTGWYPRVIVRLGSIDWLSWLDAPIISGHRWTWGDLALSVAAGLVVAIMVAVVQLLARRLARRSRDAGSLKEALVKAQNLMPTLVAEMKTDLAQYPLRREFVVLKRAWTYNGESLAYYYDDHPDLDGQLQILLNLDLIRENTCNNVKRFVMTEQFADYLTS